VKISNLRSKDNRSKFGGDGKEVRHGGMREVGAEVRANTNGQDEGDSSIGASGVGIRDGKRSWRGRGQAIGPSRNG
jgi:hypothetical protein